jgi:CheY-like chemotaxis protein
MNQILLVEDDEALNTAFRTVLSKEGYHVTCAFNGVEALEKVNISSPDLILLDLLMPKMNGIEFLRKLDQPGKYPSTAIIVFSNLDTEPEIDEALRLGARQYLLKASTTPKTLVELVKGILR